MFFFSSVSVAGGEEESEAKRGGYSSFGNREGGGVFPGGEAGWCTLGLGGCCGEGGGLNLFFRDRNVHQEEKDPLWCDL